MIAVPGGCLGPDDLVGAGGQVVQQHGDPLGSGEGGVAEQQPLAAQAGEVDLGHGALALARHGGHHAPPPLAVQNPPPACPPASR